LKEVLSVTVSKYLFSEAIPGREKSYGGWEDGLLLRGFTAYLCVPRRHAAPSCGELSLTIASPPNKHKN